MPLGRHGPYAKPAALSTKVQDNLEQLDLPRGSATLTKVLFGSVFALVDHGFEIECTEYRPRQPIITLIEISDITVLG